jgi:acyl-coenzyme A thioesterase 9
MLKALTSGNISNLRLCGHVIHTGRSSMEIVVKVELVGVRDETVMLGGLRSCEQPTGLTS